jgi:hypothetical protein
MSNWSNEELESQIEILKKLIEHAARERAIEYTIGSGYRKFAFTVNDIANSKPEVIHNQLFAMAENARP